MSESEFTDNEVAPQNEQREAITIGLPEPWPHSAVETEAIVAGAMNLQMRFTLEGDITTIAPGQLIEAEKATLSAGESIADTAMILRKLGITTYLMAKVGNDSLGSLLLRMVNEQDPALSSGIVATPEQATSYSIVLEVARKERITIHSPGYSDIFTIDDIHHDLLSRVGLFHFSVPYSMASLSGSDTLMQVLKRVKADGITTSLGFSLPEAQRNADKADWYAFLSRVLPFADMVLLDAEEALFMLRRPLFDRLSHKVGRREFLDIVSPDVISELGHQLLTLGAKIVGLRVGRRGFYLCTAQGDVLERLGRAQPVHLIAWSDRELWAPSFVTAVDKTAKAADAALAGFLMGMLRGMSPEETISAACAVDACGSEAEDMLSAIPNWPAIIERVAAGWVRFLPEGKKKSPLDMAGAGWRWSERYELWVGPQDAHY
ncbi:MAG TPA: carbohydrate kinase family protein [Ktedonobacteraceae bacterium]